MAQVNDMVGAVLVIGGGIAGVQASLDLAESGFRVYLLEEKPCIGGVMAQLDKTFPTNDCSACIFSPKLQTLAQNPNIEILAYSKLEGIEGEAGELQSQDPPEGPVRGFGKMHLMWNLRGKVPDQSS